MTTRGGTFVTLREVLDEVGKDAARFIFLTRRPDAATGVRPGTGQAAEQRQPGLLRAVRPRPPGQRLSPGRGPRYPGGLNPTRSCSRGSLLPEELALLKLLAGYPELVEAAARNLEPHRITYFLTELASQLHSYYYKHRFITEDQELTQARLGLVAQVKTVLAHGLKILGVEAPETM